jgi:hypothetical protein
MSLYLFFPGRQHCFLIRRSLPGLILLLLLKLVRASLSLGEKFSQIVIGLKKRFDKVEASQAEGTKLCLLIIAQCE